MDSELAADAAIYGKGVEMYYADEKAMPRIRQADARNAFVVYDNNVEHRPVFGVLLSEREEPAFSADRAANRGDDGGMDRSL